MFIKRIDIAKSNDDLWTIVPDKCNIFAVAADLRNAKLINAIRFVLHDLDSIDDLAIQTSIQPPYTYVRLHVVYNENDVLPTLLINCDSREFTVTRYGHDVNTIAIHFSKTDVSLSIETQPNCTLTTSEFYRLLDGMSRSQRIDNCSRALVDDFNVQVQRAIGDLNQYKARCAWFLNAFEITESLAMECRALKVLQMEPEVSVWCQQIEDCENTLGDTTISDCKFRMHFTQYFRTVLRCQRNRYAANRSLNCVDVLPNIDELVRFLELAQASIDANNQLPDTRSYSQLLEVQRQMQQSEVELFALHQLLANDEQHVAELHIELMTAPETSAASQRSANDEKLRALQTRLTNTETMLKFFRNHIAVSQQQLKSIQNAVPFKLQELKARFSAQINKYIYHMSAVHKGHLECMNATVDLYSPIMRSTFGINVLIGVDALNALFRTNTQLARNFLGYFIDFVVFREEHKELATKVQFALRDVLLVGIFSNDLSRKQCLERLKRGYVKLWAMDKYQTNGSAAMPSSLLINIQPLSEFVLPIDDTVTCRPLVINVLDEYMVMHNSTYGLDEAAVIYKRHIICAQTGRCARYECPYIEAPVQLHAATTVPSASVFEVWKRIPNRNEQQADRAAQARQANATLIDVHNTIKELLEANLQIDKMRANEWSVVLRINGLQADAFKAQLDVNSLKQSIRDVRSEQKLDDELERCVQSATHYNRMEKAIQFRRVQNAVTVQTAKYENLCADMRQLFQVARTIITSVKAVPPTESAMLHDICLRIADQRQRIENDWQRYAEHTTTCQPVKESLAANRRELDGWRRLIDVHIKSKKMIDNILHHRREKEKLNAAPELLERFAMWSPDQIASRRSELERIVYSDADLTKRRRQFVNFKKRLDHDECLLRTVAGLMPALEKNHRIRSEQRVCRIAEALRAIVVLFHHSTDAFLTNVLIVDPEIGNDVGLDTHTEIVLTRIDSRKLVHVGRNEMRFLRFLWYLADCVADGQKIRSVLLVDSAMLNVSSVNRMQMLDILRNNEMFRDLQLFCTFTEMELRRHGA